MMEADEVFFTARARCAAAIEEIDGQGRRPRSANGFKSSVDEERFGSQHGKNRRAEAADKDIRKRRSCAAL